MPRWWFTGKRDNDNSYGDKTFTRDLQAIIPHAEFMIIPKLELKSEPVEYVSTNMEVCNDTKIHNLALSWIRMT